MTEEMRNDAQASRATLLEVEEDDFGDGAEAQWRTPGAGAAGGKDLQIAEAAESVDELAIDAASDPAPGNELAEVRVAGELKRDAGSLRDFGMIGRMSQKDARACRIDLNFSQDAGEVTIVGRVAVRHANDLQAVNI